MIWRRSFVLSLLAGACGRFDFSVVPDAPADTTADAGIPAAVPSWTSGTRLRAKVADYGGGAREAFGWYDSQLALDCQITTVDPGALQYCLPPNQAGIVYSDANCTLPIVDWNTQNGPVPPFASLLTLNTCNFQYTYYSVGASISLPSYYAFAGTSCGGPYPTPGTVALYQVGADVPIDTFVKLEPARTGTSRIQASGWQTADGASYFTTLYDSERQLGCTVHETSDGPRCLTYGADATYWFADVDCTVPLVYAPSGQCGGNAGEDALDDGARTCTTARKITLGAPYSGPVFAYFGGTCASQTVTSGLYLQGPEVPLDTFELGARVTGSETGRVHGSTWRGADGTTIRTTWLDTARGNETCGTSIIDTQPRCEPIPGVGALGDYSDAACTLPLAVSHHECGPRYIYSLDGRGTTLNPIDTTAPPPTQLFHYGFGCSAGTLDTSATYYVGGPVIPFSDLAGGTLTTE